MMTTTMTGGSGG